MIQEEDKKPNQVEEDDDERRKSDAKEGADQAKHEPSSSEGPESSESSSSFDAMSDTTEPLSASSVEPSTPNEQPEIIEPKFAFSSCCCCLQSLFPRLGVDRTKLVEEAETIKLLLLGLDNAGKTTVALHLAGESVEDVVSTIGFSNYELKATNFPSSSANKKESEDQKKTQAGRKKFRIILYDLGGGKRIRSIWKNYYSLVHGILFVIDSADIERIPEVRVLLHEVVSNVKVAGKPILIYLNKQDLRDAMDEIDICKFTNLEELVSQYKCITKIEPISANNVPTTTGRLSGGRLLIDPSLASSFRWLLDFIEENWLELNTRVQADSDEQITVENDSLRGRIERTKTKQQYIEIETQAVPSNQIQAEAQEPSKEHLKTLPPVKAHARLSPIEEVSSILTSDGSPVQQPTSPDNITMVTSNNSGHLKGIMKKVESNDSCESPPLPPAQPMEIIITQPGSGGSGASFSDSRLALNVGRNNKIYPT